MDSDWILILKMKQGSEAACDAFVSKYYGRILKYCHFHARDRELAEDLTQEVFLRFFSALPRYQHQGKAMNYLYTIAANLCKNPVPTQRTVPLEQIPDLWADQTADLEDRLMLEAAIRNLPEAYREVVVLHYYQGLKLRQVAQVLNIGLPLAKYRLKQAKELLRKETAYESE